MIKLSDIVNVTLTGLVPITPGMSAAFESAPLEPTDTRMIVSDYLGAYLRPSTYRQRLDSAMRVLEPLTAEYDAIACVGNSGVLCAAPLCALLDKPMILVRKQRPHKDYAHSPDLVEGCLDSRRYVIVDDMIVSGKTLQYIHQTVSRHYDMRSPFVDAPECIGYVMLNEYYGPDYPHFVIGTADNPIKLTNLRKN